MRTAALAIMLTMVAVPAAKLVAQDEPSTRTARAAIDMPVEPNTALARAELFRLINELQSMNFRDPANPVSGGSGVNALSGRGSEQKAATADANSVKGKTSARPEPVVEQKPVIPAIVQDPNTVSNPFELAEALYKTGRYKESAACYRVALARASSEEKHAGSDAELAWMLFQIGNCYSRTEPGEAVKIYKQLMTEHPASEWTPIAISRERLIQWYIASDIAPKPESR